MGVNDTTKYYNQVSTVLNSLLGQNRGENLVSVDSGTFTSVFSTGFTVQNDPITTQLPLLIGKTLYASRPWESSLKTLYMDSQTYGFVTRKVSYCDEDMENSGSYPTALGEDGTSSDMYKISRPSILVSKVTGTNVWQKHKTIFRNQWDGAFRNADEAMQFIAGLTQEVKNSLEQSIDSLARGMMANYIGGKISATNGVIHLLTEYNTETGLSLTATSIYQPENFAPFMRWAWARINSVSDLMEDKTRNFQLQITGKNISRTTPKAYQKLFIYSPMYRKVEANTYATTYHDEIIRYNSFELVNYWQSSANGSAINVTPTFIDVANGTIKKATAAVSQANIFAVLVDRDTMGYTIFDNFEGVTPFNYEGDYRNMYWKNSIRYQEDFTEKGAIFVLD